MSQTPVDGRGVVGLAQKEEEEKSLQNESLGASTLERADDPAAEARVRRKLDWCLIPLVCLTYISAFIDRIAIGNARVAGIEADLNLKGYDYNIALTCFFITYILWEIPGILLCKKLGPSYFLPICTVLFGLFSMCTAFVTNFGQLCGLRLLLGFAEAPMLPGISYYLSRFYRKDELVWRLGLYGVCAPLGGAFGGLLASGLLRIGGIGSVQGWQQIFLVEGLVTIVIGFLAYAFLPEAPNTARWLNAEEKELAVARVVSEQVDSNVLLDDIQGFKIWNNIFETQTLVLAAQFLLSNITAQGVAIFTPTIVATIFPDKNDIHKNLLSVPPYAAGVVANILLPWLSMKSKVRSPFLVFEAVLLVVGYAMFVGSSNGHVRYGASHVVMFAAFPWPSLMNAWMSANSVSDTGRAVSMSTIAMFGNVGGLISTWSYLPNDAPNYHNGNSLNLATSSTIVALMVGLLVWMRRQNAKKDRQAVDLSQVQPTEVGRGRKHPAYRYRF